MGLWDLILGLARCNSSFRTPKKPTMVCIDWISKNASRNALPAPVLWHWWLQQSLCSGAACSFCSKSLVSNLVDFTTIHSPDLKNKTKNKKEVAVLFLLHGPYGHDFCMLNCLAHALAHLLYPCFFHPPSSLPVSFSSLFLLSSFFSSSFHPSILHWQAPATQGRQWPWEQRLEISSQARWRVSSHCGTNIPTTSSLKCWDSPSTASIFLPWRSKMREEKPCPVIWDHLMPLRPLAFLAPISCLGS